MSVQDTVDRVARERPDLILATARRRPKAWGALAAHGVVMFRSIAGRAPTDAERRAIWAGLWSAAQVAGRDGSPAAPSRPEQG